MPEVADWMAVDVLEEGGSLSRIFVTGSPHRPEIAGPPSGLYAPWPDAPHGPFRVVQTRRSEVAAGELDPGQLALSPDPQHLDALRQIGAVGSICTPLLFRGQLLGAMTLARVSEPFRPLHVAFARTLGHRVGQAIAHGRMYEELQTASRRKDEFLAMLGHELRNPLGALSNAVSVLQAGRLSREAEASMQTIIGRQLHHLTKLIGDLLDVARLTSGKIVLHLVPVNLLEIAEHSLTTIRSAGRGDGHDIQLTGGPVVVDGDSMRLEQVLDNLIDNAMKYTPPGGRIDVSIAASGHDAVLRVHDTGVGVPAELLPRMFELFTQGQQGPERHHGGLGVGLAIVKRIVNLHGGTVHATSPGAGSGTEVVVRLPLSAGTVARDSREPHAPASGRAHRILVVEDNPDARETLRLLLEQNGHQVELAADGWTGLEVASRTHPDVALIDLGLPGLDGYEVARRMRAGSADTSIRLIALTGYGQPADRRRASEAGFDSYLVKPVDQETLDHAIQASAGASGSAPGGGAERHHPS